MSTLKHKTHRGFTLIEMLLGLFIFTLLSFGVIFLVSNVLLSSNKQSNLLAGADQARKVSGNIVSELRNAQVSSVGAYPLEVAGAQTITFYTNVDGGTDVERIRYYLQNDQLYKGVIKPNLSGVPYDPANEVVNLVQNNVANGTSTLFYYYDGLYQGTVGDPLTEPVAVTAVKFVKLDLKIYNTAGVENTNAYTVTASGAVRNLKDNLGDVGLPDFTYILTTSTSPSGVGSVAESPAGPVYDEFTIVNLSASANIGYGFSSWTGDVTNPTSSATTIIMNDNESVIANFTPLTQTLTGSITSKSGSDSARRWNLRITNPNSFAVNNTNLYTFSLTQTAGPACSPTLTLPAAFPVLVGNISAGGSRTYQVTINFTGCDSTTRFTADFTFAGNGGANWGQAIITNQAK